MFVFRKLKFWLAPVLVFITSFAALSLVVFARQEINKQALFINELKTVSIRLPEDPPRLSQESIDIALAMFDIDIPAHVEHPTLDLTMTDRGLTTLTAGKALVVTIGPTAFASWSLLGSTLAHELEVHCRQNFTSIRMMDIVGLKGTDRAEREAYLYELKNSERFQLSMEDRFSILHTMEYFYPDDTENETLAGRLSRSVSTWLARPIDVAK